MARKVFFSFHYERDAWRAANVRNSDMIPNDDEYGVIDRAEWESIERDGDQAIRNWIQSQLKHTTATVVLVGSETASRDWVLYEVRESWARENGVVAVRIHGIKHHDQTADAPGTNPLDRVMLENGQPLSSVCRTYDWCTQDGRNNLGAWVEEACIIRDASNLELTETKVKVAATAGPTIIRNPPRQWAQS